jgi:SAM-dependent methyltransferase
MKNQTHLSTSPAAVAVAPGVPDAEAIRAHVRERYGDLATSGGSCCSPKGHEAVSGGCCGADANTNRFYGEALGYSAEQLAAAPVGSNLSLGCGNPLALASIRPGETVLDLGSGAGFDCFLAARELRGAGRVIGVDMTAEMVAKARANAARSGYANVEFRLGEIEALPVADASVDLILSNCVINLSPDKPAVFREAFRVLKPGGRLAIADIVALRPLPPEVRAELASIGACVGGAALLADVKRQLADAGFTRIDVAPRDGSRRLIDQWTERPDAGDYVASASITAHKPAASA